MRIEEEGPERLVLVHRPWLLGAGLAVATLIVGRVAAGLFAEGDIAGGGMIGLGALLCAGALFIFVRPARLVMDRRKGEVVFEEWTLAGRRTTRQPLGKVDCARIGRGRETFRPGDRRGARAVLVLAGNPPAMGLGDAYMGHRPAARAVAAINRWLGNEA